MSTNTPWSVLFASGQEYPATDFCLADKLLHALRQAKKAKHVLFIDASREFAQEKRQNRLRDEDLAKIVKTDAAYKSVEKYSYRAKPTEIAENEFNLNIPRYVVTFEGEEEIDIDAVQAEIDGIEIELAKTRKQLAAYLKELGYGS